MSELTDKHNTMIELDELDELSLWGLSKELNENGLPTIWVVFESGGEYDDRYDIPVGSVSTKEEARKFITDLYKDRELIIPDKVYTIAEKEFNKEVARMEANGVSDDELSDFECEPQKYFAKLHPAWTEEQWIHDYNIRNNYRFSNYYAQEIIYYNKYGK